MSPKIPVYPLPPPYELIKHEMKGRERISSNPSFHHYYCDLITMKPCALANHNKKLLSLPIQHYVAVSVLVPLNAVVVLLRRVVHRHLLAGPRNPLVVGALLDRQEHHHFHAYTPPGVVGPLVLELGNHPAQVIDPVLVPAGRRRLPSLDQPLADLLVVVSQLLVRKQQH